MGLKGWKYDPSEWSWKGPSFELWGWTGGELEGSKFHLWGVDWGGVGSVKVLTLREGKVDRVKILILRGGWDGVRRIRTLTCRDGVGRVKDLTLWD